MFERRLKIFLLIVIGISLVLCLRALQIQLVRRHELAERADKFNQKQELIDTVRGRILDCKGRELAVEMPCIDAVVYYPALPQDPDLKWLEEESARRLTKRLGEEYTKSPAARRSVMRKEEIVRLRSDLAHMWEVLASLKNEGMDELKLTDVRQSIVRKVENRKRWIWYRNYKVALDKHENRTPEPWYKAMLLGDDRPPEMDEFKVQVEDELASHPVLKAIKPETVTLLGKDLDRYPGLSLRPSTHREYPYKEAGCHWIGTLTSVTKEDRANDPNLEDDRRRYDYNDLVGRGGVEQLAEQVLRGSRGEIERSVGTNQVKSETPAVPGRDVQVTIDIELQQLVQSAFKNVTVHYRDSDGTAQTDVYPYLHGAAVVIDVATGRVLAMASNPGFDPNELDRDYAKLSVDGLEKPLFNRATQATLEPGSTVKPVVGLTAIKDGVFGVNDTIECTGYMTVNGKPVHWNRCWVASKFETILKAKGMTPAHHPIPSADPSPTGFLKFDEAEKRSCNVFFQTLAERLGFDRLAEGMSAFGLGQITGIGIPERAGLLPHVTERTRDVRGALWSAGIGQGSVAATPLQMANVAATIARGGIWMRPKLLMDESGPLNRYVPSTPSYVPSTRPAVVDLGFSSESVALAQHGMWEVVHDVGGTGKALDFQGACGKTGTAQAAAMMIPVLDENGKPVPKPGTDGQPEKDDKGNVIFQKQPLRPSTKQDPNPMAPWYLGSGNSGTDLAHAWYIGFAPQDHPKIAFCVMIEYGGSGGMTAAAVAKEVLGACVEQGYLPKN